MGNTIQTLRNNAFRKNSSVILNVRLPKLRDYHASFKSICDHFSIDLNQFEHIFGAGQSDFVIWDSDNNGLIDSLQLFSGVCIFSDTKFEDKVRFLFDVFDFNESEKLEVLGIQFMMYCCVNSTYKIFSITNEVETQELAEFSKELFSHLSRVTVADLIRITKENEEIRKFFEITKSNKNLVGFKSNS